MKIKLSSLTGKATGDVTLSADIFGADVTRTDVLQRVVRWQQAGSQAGTHQVKERNAVSLTGKKPFNQKGTGNARRGDNKAPHHTGGGVAHGPRARSHSHKLPKSIRKLGLKIALSAKVKEGNLIILDKAEFAKASASEAKKSLEKAGISNALFIAGNEVNDNFKKSIQNIKHIDVLPQIGANVQDILRHKQLVLTKDAVDALQERLGN